MTLKAEPKRKRRLLLMEPAASALPARPPAARWAELRGANESIRCECERTGRTDRPSELPAGCHYDPLAAETAQTAREHPDNRRHSRTLKPFGRTIKSASGQPSSLSASELPQTDHFVIRHQRQQRDHSQQAHNMSSCEKSKLPLAECGQQQHQQQQQHHKHQQHVRSRRKNELTSFLTILFGSLLFALTALSLRCHSQTHNASAGSLSLNTKPAPPTLATLAALPATTTASANVSSASFGDETENSEAPAESAGELPDGEAAGTGESEAEAGASERTNLRELIADSAGGGVELLLNHLTASTTTEAPLESGAESGAESEEDAEKLASDLDTNNSNSNSNSNATATSKLSASETSESTPANSGADSEMSFAPEHQRNRAAMETWAKWRATGDDIIELFSRKVLPVIMRHGYEVDSATVAGLLQVFNGIRGLRPWALKLLDASAKLAPGILVGTQSDFGDFDECLNVRADDPSGFAASNADFPVTLDEATGLKSTTLVGRYCLADVEFPKPARALRSARDRARHTGVASNQSEPTFETHLPIELRRPLLDFGQTAAFKDTIFVETGNFFHMLYVDPIRVGICLTNKIDPDSFAQVLNKLLEEFSISIHFRSRCVTKYDRVKWTVFQVYSSYILLSACALVLLSTLLDVLQLKLNKLPWPARREQARVRLNLFALRYRALYTSFSLLRNTKRLFKPQRSALLESALAEQRQQQQQQQQQQPSQVGQQFKLNLTNSSQFQAQAASKSSLGAASSIADSSVESSPSIERRASTTASSKCGSTLDLLMDGSSCSTSSNFYTPHQNQSNNNNNNSNSNSASTMLASSAQSNKVRDSNEISLLSLHGVRVLTMIWMIVNHTYMFGGFFVLWAHRRLIDIAEWPKSLSFQMVLNGWLTVETYFFLSALIIVLNVMPLMRANKFTYSAYICHRLLRLLPAYIGLVCLNFLWPLVSSGPVWLVKGKSFVQTPCENHLWTNFLFINNWIWPEKQCMVHTWFLSADFQLYILAPVIVYLLYRRPALGHTFNILVAILASVLSGFVIYANKLLPTTLINKLEFDAIKQQLSYSYFATYQHMGPYCLGILTGYLLHKRPHIHLPKYLTWLLWILLPPLSFTTLLLTYLWNGAYDEPALINPSPLVSAFYVAIHRTIWTALVAWLVFACTTGRAKLLNQLLSHSIFIPISRLSYSIYLVHLPVIMFRSLNLRHTVDWSDQNILYEACGNFLASIFMGYFLNVSFESPIINLENYISGRGRQRRLDPAGSLPAAFEIHKQNQSQNHKQQQQQVDSVRKDSSCDSGSSTETSSRHDSELAGQLTDCSQTNKTPKLASAGSERKSLRPKQTCSVERIFGQIQEPDGGHQSNSNFSTESSSGSSHCPEFERESSVEPVEGNEMEPAIRAPAHKSGDILSSSNLDRRRSAALAGGGQRQQFRVAASPARERPFNQRHRGDLETARASESDRERDRAALYNAMSGEYHHYAPAGYRQWRMYMNGVGQQAPRATNYTRPFQYATLARTNRLSQRERLMLERRNRLDHFDHRLSAYEPADESEFSAPARSGPQMGSLSELGGSRLSRAELPEFSVEELRLEASLGGRRNMDMFAARRPAHESRRYNTLTGTRMRDLRLQYNQPARLANEQQAPRGPAYQWPESAELRDDEPLPVGDSQAFWLAPSPMIPRIDSSTLRRQTRQMASGAGSILEECAQDHEQEHAGEEQKSTL